MALLIQVLQTLLAMREARSIEPPFTVMIRVFPEDKYVEWGVQPRPVYRDKISAAIEGVRLMGSPIRWGWRWMGYVPYPRVWRCWKITPFRMQREPVN